MSTANSLTPWQLVLADTFAPNAEDLFGDGVHAIIEDANGLAIAAVYSEDLTDPIACAEAEADGKLLTAAPAMAAALQECVDASDLYQLDRARASARAILRVAGRLP